MNATNTVQTNPEAQLRRFIAEQMEAICAKDIERILSFYTPDIVGFDVKPPFRVDGIQAWRKIWEECLPHFPEACGMEERDMRVQVSGDLGVAHWMFRFTDLPEDHPAMQTWIRISAAYRRAESGWKVFHEHLSVPFDPHTGQAVFTLKP